MLLMNASGFLSFEVIYLFFKFMSYQDQKTEVRLWIKNGPDEGLGAFCTFSFCLVLSFGKKDSLTGYCRFGGSHDVETAWSGKISAKPFGGLLLIRAAGYR